MGKLGRTMSLMRASWDVLRQDKELLVFPLLSGVLCLVLLASFALPLLGTVDWHAAGGGLAESASRTVGEPDTPITLERAVQTLLVFAFYVCNYFVIIFFNSALSVATSFPVGVSVMDSGWNTRSLENHSTIFTP